MSDKDNNNDIIDKSESLFEKNIVYLSAGALSISMIFIEKIVKIEKQFIFGY